MVVRRQNAAFILLGCIWFAWPMSHVNARTTYYESIELVTADADVVVRGTIAEVNGIGIDKEWDLSARYRFKAVVHISEVLKGPRSNRLTVALVSVDPDLCRWRDEKAELLLSLRYPRGRRQLYPLVFRSIVRNSVIPLGDSGAGVATMDMRFLTVREDILQAARAGVAAAPDGDPRGRIRLNPPQSSEIIRKTNRDAGRVVFLPVDERLERLGERWARSESGEYRCLAPLALSQFKSPKNAEILKRLLFDGYHESIHEGDGRCHAYFPVRASAYFILKKWDSTIQKPLIEERRKLTSSSCQTALPVLALSRPSLRIAS